jgi:hypothetical protein
MYFFLRQDSYPCLFVIVSSFCFYRLCVFLMNFQLWKQLGATNTVSAMPREEAAACLLTIVTLRDIAGREELAKASGSDAAAADSNAIKGTVAANARRLIGLARKKLHQQTVDCRVADVFSHRAVNFIDTVPSLGAILVKDEWSLGHVLHLINTSLTKVLALGRFVQHSTFSRCISFIHLPCFLFFLLSFCHTANNSLRVFCLFCLFCFCNGKQ